MNFTVSEPAVKHIDKDSYAIGYYVPNATARGATFNFEVVKSGLDWATAIFNLKEMKGQK